MVKVQQLESDINLLKEYYKELNDLKGAGIDLTKIDAHNVLVRFMMETLFNDYGVDRTVEILKYAEHPVMTFNEFVNYLYPPCEQKPEVKEEVDKPTDHKTEDENPKTMFYINGQPVNQEDYNKLMQIVENAISDAFNKIF